MHRECRERFLRHPELATPTCITSRALRTCRDAHRDRKLTGSFEVGGGENVPRIAGACATRNLRIWKEAHSSVPKHGSII